MNYGLHTHNSLTQTSQTLGNGITTNYTYDELLRLSSLGNYNLLVDDFQNNGTGTIYRGGLISSNNLEQFNIDWLKVVNGEDDSLKHQIDLNNDGIFDLESYYNSLQSSENELGSITGYVSGDKNMAGWKVFLDSNADGEYQENEKSFEVTDNQGYYEFTDIPKGTYGVVERPHKNWEIVYPTSQSYEIQLNNGQHVKNLNFENVEIK